MHCSQWIFDMDGTLTDSMTVVWEGAPDALLRRYGRTPRADLRATLLSMGMQEGARYLIREYDLPLTEESYFAVMREVIAELYETVELKPGVRTMLAKLQAEGARMCICSNTWADQCRTVLTRLGIAGYFSFIVEAQGVLHKSRPEVFFECMSRLGGAGGCSVRRFHGARGRILRRGHRRPRLCRRRAGDAPRLQPVPPPVGCTGLDRRVIKKGRRVRFFFMLKGYYSCFLPSRRV